MIHVKLSDDSRNFLSSVNSAFGKDKNALLLALSKAIANVSWSDIVSKIEYKMTEKQGHLIKIDQFYPSSKTCSSCGSAKQEMPLEIRIYECSECSYTEDRDINAAKNILAEAKRIANI